MGKRKKFKTANLTVTRSEKKKKKLNFYMGKLEENGKQRKSCMSKRVCVYTNERKCTYENIFRLKNQHYKSEG